MKSADRRSVRPAVFEAPFVLGESAPRFNWCPTLFSLTGGGVEIELLNTSTGAFRA